jgi:hypothetical protein
VHSIRYQALDRHFYVFAVREGNRWLSWEEVQFYAAMIDLPTVPVLWTEATPADKNAYEQRILEAVSRNSAFDSRDAATGKPCTMEGLVSRNAAGFATDAFAHHVFKWVRKGHVQTNEHWTRNWHRAPLKHEGGHHVDTDDK